jgi:membrane fusion protein (multidrug efflux system)
VRLLGAVRPQALQIPSRAVLEGPQGRFVYLAQDGKAVPRTVQVGEQLAGGWIVTQGLAAGDPVIVDGTARIFFPGAPIQPAPPVPAASAAKIASIR